MTRVRTPIALLLAIALTVAVWPPAASAQGGAELEELRSELEALEEGQRAIRDELEAIRRLLQRGQPTARSGPVEPAELVLHGLQDDPAMGAEDAGLLLIEYADYQCPFCRRHLEATVPELKRDYVDAGKLSYVFRDFPLESIHPHAFKAAEAANCAGEQGRYWEMHEILFANVRRQAPRDLQEHARTVGLDGAAFADCLVSGRQAEEVRQDIADGQNAGVRGTPTFFLAVPGERPGTATTLMRIRGAQPYSVFKDAIERSLAELEGAS